MSMKRRITREGSRKGSRDADPAVTIGAGGEVHQQADGNVPVLTTQQGVPVADDQNSLKVGGRGDITTSHLLWSTANGPDVPTPVTDGKYFYVVNDRGIMWCLDARTGAEIYGNQRIKPAIYSGSPVLADGKIYVTNEEGLTTVVQAGPEFKVLAENPLNDYVLSSPAISDGRIYLRTSQHLYAIGSK